MAAQKLKSCLHCSKQFHLSYNGQQFCSDPCRFWAKVSVAGENDCWMWQGTTPAFGHGQFRFGGRAVYSHRYSWTLKNGPISDEICVLHKCDVPACVNPAHLFLGSREENLTDMRSKGRGCNPPLRRGSRHSMAKLDEDAVRAIRESSESQLEIAHRYGISRRNVNSIIRRRIWKHVS